MEPTIRPVTIKEAAVVFFITIIGALAASVLFGGCGGVQEQAVGSAGGAAAGNPGQAQGGYSGHVGVEAAGGALGVGNAPGGAGGAGGAAQAGAAGGGQPGGASGAGGMGGDGAAGQCGSCTDNQICWHGLCACRPPSAGTGNTTGSPCGTCPGQVHYCPGACLPIGVDPDCQ